MMKFLRPAAIVFVFLVLLSAGCGKDALEVRPELEGTWLSSHYTLHNGWKVELMADVCGRHNKADSGAWLQNDRVLHSGKASVRGNVLHIGSGRLKIGRYPGLDSDGNLSLEMAGETFYGAKRPTGLQCIAGPGNAMFQWDQRADNDPATVIEIDYRLQNSTGWNTETADYGSEISKMITVSVPGTYEWRIRSVNGMHASDYSPVATFMIQ